MPVTLGATPTEVNFDGSALTPPAGRRFVTWQAGTAVPDPNNPEVLVRDVSAHVPNIGSVDARATTTETIAVAALGKLVTFSNAGAIAVTLDSTVPTDFFCFVEDLGVGTATLTPSSGTINGVANLPLSTGSGGILFFDGTNWKAVTGGGGGGGGVTSVGLTMPAEFSVAGSPVTGAGTLAVTKANEAANAVYAGPTSGGAAAPTFRALVQGDLPAQPFDVLFNPNQVLGSGAIYDVAVFVRTVVFPGNFSGSAGKCRVNPGTTQTINVNKNGSQIGQISISNAGAFTFTTTSGAAQTYNAGDYMTLTNQAGADASMLMQVTLTGTR